MSYTYNVRILLGNSLTKKRKEENVSCQNTNKINVALHIDYFLRHCLQGICLFCMSLLQTVPKFKEF